MILLKAVRFLILDQCLNVFFEELGKNIKVDNLTKIPVVGEFYSRLESKDGSEIFFSCKILDIYNTEDGSDFYVDFEYLDYDFIDPESRQYSSVEEYLSENDMTSDSSSDDYGTWDDDDDDDIFDDDDDDINTDTIIFSEFKFIK